MFSIREFERQRQARARQQRVQEDMQYRRSMREIQLSQKQIAALIERYAREAVAAERDGQHAQALRYAAEVQRLKKYQASSGSIRSTLESAHAMSATGRAMGDILAASGGLMETALEGTDPAALAEMQSGIAAASEAMELMAEQNDMLFESMDDQEADEAGEKALADIMDANRRKQRSRLLDDTNRQLDRVRRARSAEKGKE